MEVHRTVRAGAAQAEATWSALGLLICLVPSNWASPGLAPRELWAMSPQCCACICKCRGHPSWQAKDRM